MSIAAVVLAAGASRRLGSLKQLAMLGEETLLERAVRVAQEAGCSPVIAVLGAESEQVLRFGLSDGVVAVINHEWEEGMGASIRLGVRACGADVKGVVVMTCDQPAVTAEHLQLLMTGDGVKASRYAGKNGVPAFFPAQEFDALRALTGDQGARELLKHARYEELKGGELDVDTLEDLARARELFG